MEVQGVEPPEALNAVGQLVLTLFLELPALNLPMAHLLPMAGQ